MGGNENKKKKMFHLLMGIGPSDFKKSCQNIMVVFFLKLIYFQIFLLIFSSEFTGCSTIQFQDISVIEMLFLD